ncbi:MAG TPA: class I SAM-dependent methyltransferase [Candidatus Eisenbacteria bacterium]|nr:class I SAM-dependent methyltransferase [Candidatus Eisenbacteria bacterium]
MKTAPAQPYDASRAASYWSGPRHESGDELASVLSLGEPPAVNRAYDAWETGLLLDSLGDVSAERGVDIGAGVGRVSVRVAPRVRRLACVDLAPGMLRRLRANASGAGARNSDPVRARSDRLPFRSGSFGLVLCLGLLEHLPRSVQSATLAEAARVLRPGGVLALVLNNPESRFLTDAGDNPYRDGLQRESGYYCAVVSEPAILAEASAAFEDRVLGSNLFYSLHRHAARALSAEARADARLAPFFERAAAWDLALRPVGPLARAAADHHLHLLVRR